MISGNQIKEFKGGKVRIRQISFKIEEQSIVLFNLQKYDKYLNFISESS